MIVPLSSSLDSSQVIFNLPTRLMIMSMILYCKMISTQKDILSGSFSELPMSRREWKSSSICLTWSRPKVSTTREWKSSFTQKRDKSGSRKEDLATVRARRTSSFKRDGQEEEKTWAISRTTTRKTRTRWLTSRDATILSPSLTPSSTTMTKYTSLIPNHTPTLTWMKTFVRFNQDNSTSFQETLFAGLSLETNASTWQSPTECHTKLTRRKRE